MSDVYHERTGQLRPPDPGHDPPSQISLASASKTIASMESIFKTTKRIVDGNIEADAQTGFAERLRDLQVVIHRGMGSVPLSSVSSLHDLLEEYHRYVLFLNQILNSCLILTNV